MHGFAIAGHFVMNNIVHPAINYFPSFWNDALGQAGQGLPPMTPRTGSQALGRVRDRVDACADRVTDLPNGIRSCITTPWAAIDQEQPAVCRRSGRGIRVHRDTADVGRDEWHGLPPFQSFISGMDRLPDYVRYWLSRRMGALGIDAGI
jgi:hypothetical protein